MTARYPYGAHKGAGRELTDDEVTRLQALHADAPSFPPWTEASAVRRRLRDEYVMDLFDDGCTYNSLATALQVDGVIAYDKYPAVRLMIQRCKDRGYGTGTRRYIPVPAIERIPAFRPLTEQERAEVERLYTACPLFSPAEGSRRTGRTDEGRAFRSYIAVLHEDSVTLQEIADVVGVDP